MNILQKRDALGQNGRVESMQFILRTILVITFHKLYQQHSERLFSQSSEQKVIGISKSCQYGDKALLKPHRQTDRQTCFYLGSYTKKVH